MSQLSEDWPIHLRLDDSPQVVAVGEDRMSNPLLVARGRVDPVRSTECSHRSRRRLGRLYGNKQGITYAARIGSQCLLLSQPQTLRALLGRS